MSGRRTIYIGTALAMLISTLPIVAQNGTYTEYAVKFVCGVQGIPNSDGVPRETVKPGNYATEINIHNPQPDIPGAAASAITFLKQVVIAAPEGAAKAAPTATVSDTLTAGEAEFVDCKTIHTLLKSSVTTFITGFVVILIPAESVTVPETPELDVVAVYSSEPPAVTNTAGAITQIPGIALDVVTVQPRTVTIVPPPNG